MKLYISFDTPDLERALMLAPLITPYIDTIIIGSILLYQYGISIIDSFKTACPDTPILVDTKILEHGKTAISLFATHKPQWITVMAGAGNQTIHATCSAAHEMRIKSMMHLLDAASLGQSAMEAERLGADALIFYQSYDAENPLTFMDKWDLVKENTKLPVFISTKITRNNIKEIVSFKPDGIIIESTVLDTKKPELEAHYFFEITNKS